MKVWILTASWGEYEDVDHVILGVFSSEDAAQASIEKCKKAVQIMADAPLPLGCDDDGPTMSEDDPSWEETYAEFNRREMAKYYNGHIAFTVHQDDLKTDVLDTRDAAVFALGICS